MRVSGASGGKGLLPVFDLLELESEGDSLQAEILVST